MNFKEKTQLFFEEHRDSITLTIGKHTLFEDLPGDVYSYKEAPLSRVTRGNLESWRHNSESQNRIINYGKVYVIDRSQGRKANSYYITGELNGKPFVYARIETAGTQSGQTYIYFENAKMRATDYMSCKVTQENGLYVFRNDDAVRYTLDSSGTILHRLDGPAIKRFSNTEGWYKNGKKHREDGPAVIIPGYRQEYWLNGRQYERDIWEALTKVKPEDQDTMKDLMNI